MSETVPISGNFEDELDSLSHEDLCEITQSSLRRLIAADALLNDLPGDVTAEEVVAQIAVVQGQSITVTVLRYSEGPLNVVIPQKDSTVLDLKKAIHRSFTLKQLRQRSKTKISWKYVWRTYNLQNVATGRILHNNTTPVAAYDITNKSEVMFHAILLFQILSIIVHAQKYPWLDQIARQELLGNRCAIYTNTTEASLKLSQLDHVLVDHTHKLLYCYVPKVACTNWKRVLMVLANKSTVTNLVDIPASLAHHENSTIKLSDIPEDKVKVALRDYTTFLMVRHPFERLLSAYRNKFSDAWSNSKYFQERYGRHIIKKYRVSPSSVEVHSGANVTFREFVRFLLNEGVDTNEHWMPIYQLCLPCMVNYTFVGRYETLSEDARTVLEMVGASRVMFPLTRTGNTKELLRSYFQELSIGEIKQLFRLYEMDFRLFGYGLEEILGYELG